MWITEKRRKKYPHIEQWKSAKGGTYVQGNDH